MVSKKTPSDSTTEGEFILTGQGPKSGFWSGPGFVNARVEYLEHNGFAIAEGDICIGTIEEMSKSNEEDFLEKKAAEEAAKSTESIIDQKMRAGVIVGAQYRWPNCTMPYEIDPNLPNPTRVTDAIKHWLDNTGFKFVRRTTQTDYVYFTDQGGCWSMVGRRGGKQIISLGANCSTGNTIHEIGHAIGLWHEQSRNDRDSYVRINWTNIDPQYYGNFSQYLNSGVDVGPYDYCSIMHYSRTAFSKNGQDTITPLRPGADCMGQRNGLSPMGIAAIKSIYPDCILSIQTTALYRYYKGEGDSDHFYTTDWNELGSGAQRYTFEGIQCYVYAQQQSGTVPLYRYYKGEGDSDHFYTTDWNELGSGAQRYTFEGIQCYVYALPQTPTASLSSREFNPQILAMDKQNLPGLKQSGSVSNNELGKLSRSKHLGRINISIDITSEFE